MLPNRTGLPRVLVVDDARVVRKTIIKFLDGLCDVIEAADGLEALAALKKDRTISLVFSDIGMPNMDGYELVQKIRAADDAHISALPVVMVTGSDDSEGVKEKVLMLGATDIIGKPFNETELKSRAAGYANFSQRVSDLEQTQAKDSLTGLATQSYFQQQSEKAIAFALRYGHAITLVSVSMDKYKALREQLGDRVMDKLLGMIASIFQKNLRTEDYAAYYHGGKFVLLLPGTDPQGAENALKRVHGRTTSMNLRMGGRVVHISFSTGIASQMIVSEQQSLSDILEQAEYAMHQATLGGGRKTVRFIDKRAEEAGNNFDHASNIEATLLKLSAGTEIDDTDLLLCINKFLPLLKKANDQVNLSIAIEIGSIEQAVLQGKS